MNFIIFSIAATLLIGTALQAAGVYERTITVNQAIKCAERQVELYGDLCAESSSGYEEMTGTDAYIDGVTCASESIVSCIEGTK